MDPDRIEGAAREVYGHTEEGLGRLTGDRGTQARGTVDRVAGTAQNAMGQARDTALDLMDRGGGGLSDMADAAQNAVSRSGAALRRRLEEQPVSTVLIAAAVGWALALLMRGARR